MFLYLIFFQPLESNNWTMSSDLVSSIGYNTVKSVRSALKLAKNVETENFTKLISGKQSDPIPLVGVTLYR